MKNANLQKKYVDKIDTFIITTKDIYKIRVFNDKKVVFVPNFLI